MAGKFCRDRLFIFSMSSTRKFIFRYTKARLFIFICNKILKKQKKKKNKTKQNRPPKRGGGVRMLVQKGARTRTGFSMGFFAHYQVMYVHVHIYIIVSKRIVIEGGFGVLPQNYFLVIFIQNGAVLGNSNGYTCLDIMPQQEGRLPLYLIRDVQYTCI